MAAPFRVALSGDFRKADGAPVFPDFELAPLRDAANVEFAYLSGNTPVSAAELAGFDALILLAGRFEAASIPADGRLAVVARFGVGYDNVDVPACTRAGIALVITPDGVRRPVAVAIMTLMLALAGKLFVKHELTKQGPPGFAARGQHMGVGLVNKTLASVGIGNIGAEMFRLAKPFGMTFIAHDPYADAKVAAELGVELVPLEDVFKRGDVVTVNCPLTEQTKHIVNEKHLGLMKPTAYFINTARGPIVDQKALTKVLQEKRIAGAGLDVFENEPTDAADPLLHLDNVIVTPHALCWTDQCFAGIGAADVKAVLDVQRGLVPRGVVNGQVLDSPVFKARLQDYAKRFGK